MNLNQLEYFVNVAETLNFTKAAAKCFISQTAMTQQISSLEKTVGVPLFIRDKHHVELTAAGKVYLNEARIILERSNEALRLARLVSEGAEGEITIGYISGYGQTDFSSLLRRFHSACPNVKINLLRNNLSVLQQQLDTGKCDLLFAVTPYKRDYLNFGHKYINSYPVMAVLNEGHPLAGKEQLTYQELERENFIMLQPSNRSKDQMEESLLIYQRGGYLPNVVGIEGDPETLLLMVSVGMGISILPEYITHLYENNKDLKIIPMVKEDGTAETVDLEASWLPDNPNPALAQMLGLL